MARTNEVGLQEIYESTEKTVTGKGQFLPGLDLFWQLCYIRLPQDHTICRLLKIHARRRRKLWRL